MGSVQAALKALRGHWKTAWKPPPRQNVWEWAEDNVFIPSQASPRPGKYSTELFPYVRTPMECWTDKTTETVVLMWAAQSTKTTCEFMCLNYDMANYQGNILFNMPSEDMAKSKSLTTLQPMIESSPRLKMLKPTNKNKFKILEMHMQNGVVNFIGGNSATNLASRSAGRIYTDEIDKLKRELKGEADPLSLLFERAEFFPDRKFFLTSTPTLPEAHINQWFHKGTQEFYHYPCPDCGEFFTAKWKHVKWQDEDDMSNDQKAATAYIECPHCQYHIKNKHKRQMLKAGEWRKENEGASGKIRSFHFNRIMSPISKLSTMVEKFLQATERAKTGDLGELKNFVNSALAEVWRDEAGKVMKDEEVDILVNHDHPRGFLPEQALGLVAGVDTQKDGFYFSVHAFGKNNTSWLVNEGFVPDFKSLESNVIKSSFDGRRIEAVFMDAAGDKTDQVYKFCRKYQGLVVPCFGRGNNLLSEYSFVPVDKGVSGKAIGGLMRCSWNTNNIKDLVFGKLRVNPGDEGSFNLHAEVSREFKRAMTSEYKNDKNTYEHRSHIPNHYLDTTALAFLAARILGIEYREPIVPAVKVPDQGKKQKEKRGMF